VQRATKLEAFWNAKACRLVKGYRHFEAGTSKRQQQFTSPDGLTFQKHWPFNQYIITHFCTMFWASTEREFLRHYLRTVSVLRIPLCRSISISYLSFWPFGLKLSFSFTVSDEEDEHVHYSVMLKTVGNDQLYTPNTLLSRYDMQRKNFNFNSHTCFWHAKDTCNVMICLGARSMKTYSGYVTCSYSLLVGRGRHIPQRFHLFVGNTCR
jgi:hypothetical protein